MEEETVEPQETIEEPQEVQEIAQEEPQEKEETKVPLSALQKERKKRQELELELGWERKRARESFQPQQEDDSYRYESATKEDLSRSQEESLRIIEERLWIKQNPEKHEKVNELLPQFLKQRPNLTYAIQNSSNRYEEAYTLMEALTPKQQKQLEKAAAPKREAPNNPSSVPKAASLNQAIDVMQMSDSEFNEWRKKQKRR